MKSLFLAMIVSLTLFAGLNFTTVESQNHDHLEFSLEPIQKSYAQDSIEVDPVAEASQENPSQPVIKASLEIPEGDPAASLVKLVTDWKKMSPVAIGILLILFVGQASKSGWIESLFGMFGWKNALEWKRTIITVTGVLYGIFYLISTGSQTSAAIVAILSAGGAVALFEAGKGIYYLLGGKKKA